MKKTLLILVFPVALLLVLAGVFWVALGRQKAPLSKPPAHGVCFTVQAEASASESAQRFSQLKDAITKRFAQFGARIFWEPASGTQFRIYAPILDAAAVEEAVPLVSQEGLLELRLVHANSRDLIERGETAEGYVLLKHKIRRMGNQDLFESCLVSTKPEGGPSGIHIAQAMATEAPMTGRYEIGFKLTPESAQVFREITRTNIGRQLAIVIDGVLLSAPIIRSEIAAGYGVISGDFSRAKAAQLASLLETPLPVPVKLLETKSF